MTWIKICGMTNLEDAQAAVDAGADALGFVFYKKSPRNIAPEVAREIIAKLPAQIEKVGVFVGEDWPDQIDIVREVGLTGVQRSLGLPKVNAQELPKAVEFASSPLPTKLIWSIPTAWFLEDERKIDQFVSRFSHPRGDDSGTPIPANRFDTVLLDSATAEQPGGTGKVFDWLRGASVAESLQQGGLKVVVAGGLTPTNVAEAMRILKPWGVDVSSGVEAEPGKKDRRKVQAFISAVRRADEIG